MCDENESVAPGEQFAFSTDDEIEKIAIELYGKSIREYSEWRWPDEPETQYLIVLDTLSRKIIEKGNIYAVYDSENKSIIKNLNFKEAEQYSTNYNNYIVPMKALNSITTF